MYKRVDLENETDVLQGFCYINKDGKDEYIDLIEDTTEIVDIRAHCCDPCSIYVSDIPNLIRALQATYNHITKD